MRMYSIEERQRGRKRKTDGNYASKYYDPDKAHEYYMKHRKLKGDSSSSSDDDSSSSSTKKSSTKKSSTKKSTEEKDLLAKAKDAIDNNIADLKGTVADWVDKQNELIDNETDSKKKKAIRNRIKAVKREMNKQIRAAKKLYRQWKSAYTNGTIKEFAASQAAKEESKDDEQK